MKEAFNPDKFRTVFRSYLLMRFMIILPAIIVALVVVPVALSQQASRMVSAVDGVAVANFNAVGLLAFSYVNAAGLFALSYVNTVGLIGFGGVSSLGIVAVGGANAVGVIAIGGANAVGVVAVGYNAVGIVAIGVQTSGIFCLSLSGRQGWWGRGGRHVFSPDRQDSKAVEFFTRWMPRLKSTFSSSS